MKTNNKKTDRKLMPITITNTNVANDELSGVDRILARPLDVAGVSVPDEWHSVWSEFGVWTFKDPEFGTIKSTAGSHRQLIKDIARLSSHCNNPKKWSAVATRARIAIGRTLSSSDDGDECITALVTAYSFAMAMRTGEKQWAMKTCAAAAVARAYRWSAYGFAFSADLIYKRTSAETLVAQKAEFSRLLESCKGIERWAA